MLCVCLVMSNSVTPRTVAHQALLSMEFSRQEYWRGLPFPASEDLPNSGVEPVSLVTPELAGRLFTPAPLGKLKGIFRIMEFILNKS